MGSACCPGPRGGTTLQACVEQFGRVDCLVNAAGLTSRSGVVTGSVIDWDQQVFGGTD